MNHAPPLRWWLEKNIRRGVTFLVVGVVLIVFGFNFWREASSRLSETQNVAEGFLERETRNLQLFDYLRISEDMQAAFAKSGVASARLINGREHIASWSQAAWTLEESTDSKAGAGLTMRGGKPTLLLTLSHPTLPGINLIMAIPVLDSVLSSAVLAFLLAFGLFLLSWIFLKKLDRSLAQLSAEIETFALEISRNSGFETTNVRPEDSIVAETQELKSSFISLMSRLSESENKRVAAETSRALTDLAVQVAHDIRSPLSAMKIAISSRGGLAEAGELLSAAVERIEKIASDLLIQRKSDVSAESMALKDLRESTEKVITEVAMNHRQVKMENRMTKIDGRELSIAIGQAAFERVLSNLLTNSAAVSSTVAIDCVATGDRLNVKIQDNGPGIPQAVLSALENGRSHTTKPDGNGLGLLHVKKTIESRGGQLTIQPTQGQGTLIEISLPTKSL